VDTSWKGLLGICWKAFEAMEAPAEALVMLASDAEYGVEIQYSLSILYLFLVP